MSDTISQFVVKGALALLIAFSVVTWALVVVKGLQSSRSKRQDQRFKAALGESSRLPNFDLLANQEGPTARVARVWRSPNV